MRGAGGAFLREEVVAVVVEVEVMIVSDAEQVSTSRVIAFIEIRSYIGAKWSRLRGNSVAINETGKDALSFKL